MAKPAARPVRGECTCGAVGIEFDYPAFWAWHDHSRATQRAQGAAYATYIGCWRSRMRFTKGSDLVARFEDAEKRTARSFCARCGTPLLYERGHSPQMVNLPRALFAARTGREPRYHVGLAEAAEWAYAGEKLRPLRGYPGVMWGHPKRRIADVPAEFAGPD